MLAFDGERLQDFTARESKKSSFFVIWPLDRPGDFAYKGQAFALQERRWKRVEKSFKNPLTGRGKVVR
jgi:hypothetical protein